MAWTTLSAEIRYMVLKLVSDDYSYDLSQPYLRVGYATVCREWQPIFEFKNFQRLIIDQDGIHNLAKFMSKEENMHRREYLEHLFLRIKLDEYDCTVCQSEEDIKTIRKNNEIFSKAIWDLLTILSKWAGLAKSNTVNGRSQEGITFELGVHSPSDCKHIFKEFHFGPYQQREELGNNLLLALDNLNDPDHGWAEGRRVDPIGLASRKRIMGILTLSPGRPRFSGATKEVNHNQLENGDLPSTTEKNKVLPKVGIITNFLIRRQFYRRIAPQSLGRLIRSFTCLTGFHQEGWLDMVSQQQLEFERDFKLSIIMKLPSSPTIRNLSIFEDFNKVLHPKLNKVRPRTNLRMGTNLEKFSRSLENLSVAFIVDAEDFFDKFWPTKPLYSVTPWENLKSLALTARRLHPDKKFSPYQNLLIATGRAAAFMPKLEVMEIWNGGEGHAALFQYTNISGTPPQIQFGDNWPRNKKHSRRRWYNDIVPVWANLPQHQRHPYGDFKAKLIQLGRMGEGSYTTALRYMKLRSKVLDPISYYHALWEDECNFTDKRAVTSQVQ